MKPLRLPTLLLLSYLLMGLQLLAQQPASVNVFCPNGETMVLTLDGQVVNQTPHAQIRLTGLVPGAHSATAAVTPLGGGPSRNVNITLNLQPAMDYTYSIKANSRGQYMAMMMGANGSTPVQNFAAFHVTGGGWAPDAPANVGIGTTTTTTGIGTTTSVGMGVGANGVGVGTNVSVTETNGTTTTSVDMGGMGVGIGMNVTVTETGGGVGMNTNTQVNNPGPGYQVQQQVVYNGPTGCPVPMPDNLFAQTMGRINGAQLAAARLAISRQEISQNCMTSAQIRQIVSVQLYESEKLDLAKFAYDFVWDCGNYRDVMNGFQWNSNAEGLEQFLQSRPCNGPRPGPGPRVDPVPPPQPVGPPNPMPGYTGRIGVNCDFPTMNDGQFQSAIASIESNSFSSTQKTVAISILNQNCITSGQARQIIDIFSFDSDKLEMAKLCYDRCFDVDNFHSVYSAIDFESTRSKLVQHVNSRPGRPNPWAMQQPAPGPGWNQNPQPGPGWQNNTQYPNSRCGMPTMNDGQWQGALGSVRSNSFASTQKEVARSIASQNCLTVGQIRQLLEIFSFESDKLEMAKFCYDRCLEPQNYYMLNDVFTFDSSVSDLTNYTAGRR